MRSGQVDAISGRWMCAKYDLMRRHILDMIDADADADGTVLLKRIV